MTSLLDPIPLAQALIRAPSVTPVDAGALDTLSEALEALGFRVWRWTFGEVPNLYARLGTKGPNFCFAGHTDVVPPGDNAAWSSNPFAANIVDGVLTGRGAADMKSAIAAFVAAIARRQQAGSALPASVSLLITGDEEGPALDGTKRLLEAIAAEGEKLDHCLVGEPTNPSFLGETIKNGRRGSLNATLTVRGVQGHVAYPERAANPIRPLSVFLSAVQARVLDAGAPGFQPSNLEVTTVDVGNPTVNLIPSEARARLNIRFNTAHTGSSLSAWLEAERAKASEGFAGSLDLDIKVSGEAFFTDPGPFTDLLQDAVEAAIGVRPELTTFGGTSDARFIKSVCPVAEFGLVGATMHQVDERVDVADIEALTTIYEHVLGLYAERFAAQT
jgi:succinyl-diaminopimelate desuccinylase